jgi:hypothetical protein
MGHRKSRDPTAIRCCEHGPLISQTVDEVSRQPFGCITHLCELLLFGGDQQELVASRAIRRGKSLFLEFPSFRQEPLALAPIRHDAIPLLAISPLTTAVSLPECFPARIMPLLRRYSSVIHATAIFV